MEIKRDHYDFCGEEENVTTNTGTVSESEPYSPLCC
jgi:hypothetical protein